MRKTIWLRKLTNTSNAFRIAETGPHRFSIDLDYPRQMVLPDDTVVPCFELSELYEDKDGNWICTWPQIDTYISLEQLMGEYVIEGSKVDSYIKGLESFKELSLEEGSKNVNKDIMNLCKELYGPDQKIESEGVEEIVERKINDTDEGHKENIHTLHSGESKTDKE
jgi:hypothetical protein